jgi:hypothetical protein
MRVRIVDGETIEIFFDLGRERKGTLPMPKKALGVVCKKPSKYIPVDYYIY